MTDNHIGETAERVLADRMARMLRIWRDRPFMGNKVEATDEVLAEYDRIRTAPPVAESGKEYRAVTIEDAVVMNDHMGKNAIDEWPSYEETLAALQSIGAVVPAATGRDGQAK